MRCSRTPARAGRSRAGRRRSRTRPHAEAPARVAGRARPDAAGDPAWPASVCPKSSGWRAVGGAEAGRGPASHKPMRRRATAAFIWTRRPAPTCSSALARSKPVAVRPPRRSAQARVRPPRLAPAMRTCLEGWEVTTSRRWGCTPTAAARRPGRRRRRPADHCPSSPSPVRWSPMRRPYHPRQTSTRSSSRRSKR